MPDDEPIDLGDFTQYEIPDPIEYTFVDDDDVPESIAGLVPAFVMRRVGGVAVTKSGVGVVDAAPDQSTDPGDVTWTPVAGDFYEPGVYVAEFVAASIDRELRSPRLTWRVDPAASTEPSVSMMGLCETWANALDVDDCGGSPTPDPQLIERMLVAASIVCFRLGGNRWPGVCDDTVQPGGCGCMSRPWPVDGGVGLVPVGMDGRPCNDHGLLRLPEFPVVDVTEVRIRGDVLDAAAYRIVDDAALVRVDGGSWPSNGSPGDVPPNVEVDYRWGGRRSELGRRAAAVLARELLLAVCKPDSCRLDRRVTSIVREGVNMDFAMPGLVESLVQGHIGLPEVDLFVAAENPSKLRREGRFVIPGVTQLDDHRVR